jgi:hypothetical protein
MIHKAREVEKKEKRRKRFPVRLAGSGTPLPGRMSQTPQSLPVAMVSSISSYFFNTSVRYPDEIETACAAIRSQ